MIRYSLLALSLFVAAPGRAADGVAGPAAFDLARPEIVAFVDEQVRAGADREQTLATLGQAQSQPRIIEAISRPAEKSLQWWEYRARFLTDERIDAGVRLWREHRELLESIARTQRVSPQYILAILGVETYYGRITGRYRVIDALATLAFDYPPRSPFFRSELGNFLQLAREEKLNPLSPLGSYAGAMGIAQFMPSSYRRYAVNAGGKPARDLWNDWADVFASVGNYLREHGWQYGGTVLADAQYQGEAVPVIADSLTINDTLGALRQRGFKVAYDAADDTPAVAINAPLATDRANYRIGFRNFHVITRYNRSPLYAMAVSDLADAIAARMRQGDAP
jgi:membrane-bound lytic murein transglycosylase B